MQLETKIKHAIDLLILRCASMKTCIYPSMRVNKHLQLYFIWFFFSYSLQVIRPDWEYIYNISRFCFITCWCIWAPFKFMKLSSSSNFAPIGLLFGKVLYLAINNSEKDYQRQTYSFSCSFHFHWWHCRFYLHRISYYDLCYVQTYILESAVVCHTVTLITC